MTALSLVFFNAMVVDLLKLAIAYKHSVLAVKVKMVIIKATNESSFSKTKRFKTKGVYKN